VAVARPTTLVLRALGLGDLLVAVPALRGLRSAHPGDRLVLAAPAPLAPLTALIGAVDAVLPATGLDSPLPARLSPPPSLAVNLHGAGPQSTRALLALKPDRVWAYAHPELPEVDGPRWRDREHERLRWCRLLAAYGVGADPDDLDLAVPDEPPPVAGAVVVHPGAAYGSRRWPAGRFAAVAAALRRAGHRVVVTGSAAERELATGVAVRAGLPPAAVLAGRTGLLELAALIAAARLVLCGDTGVAHLATGYRTPSVLLFGPTPPAEWGPPDREGQVVLWKGSGPGETFADSPDPALLELGVPEVLAAASRALELTDDDRQGRLSVTVASQ
jgi:ADP-heptose:LPS heptosyltransferase